MLEVNLYKPNSINLTIPWPETWNELSLPEIKYLAVSIHTPGINQYQLFLYILQQRIQAHTIYRTPRKALRIIAMIDIEQMAIELNTLIQFLLDDINLSNQPFPTLKPTLLTRILAKFPPVPNLFRVSIGGVPERRGGKYHLHGPSSDFNSITVGEYENTEIHFLNYIQDHSRTHLHKLAAILWRAPNTKYINANGEAIHTAHTEKYFSKLPDAILWSIYLWYMACRNTLPALYPLVYGGTDTSSSTIDILSFTKMVHYGAGERNGTRMQLRHLLLKEFLFDCQLQAEQSPDIID